MPNRKRYGEENLFTCKATYVKKEVKFNVLFFRSGQPSMQRQLCLLFAPRG
ncbi:hypothetical protein DPMN_022969 [Dreissena polymorpha]|uniref:Uncharacterized protein n=1 Tax=Dreissena polymorpha TaxID=45954 RepID=A0A9D4LLE0_DREPO|nr:hypothetical protein DPMN_022969 [Dreissena polymorpha]